MQIQKLGTNLALRESLADQADLSSPYRQERGHLAQTRIRQRQVSKYVSNNLYMSPKALAKRRSFNHTDT